MFSSKGNLKSRRKSHQYGEPACYADHCHSEMSNRFSLLRAGAMKTKCESSQASPRVPAGNLWPLIRNGLCQSTAYQRSFHVPNQFWSTRTTRLCLMPSQAFKRRIRHCGRCTGHTTLSAILAILLKLHTESRIDFLYWG